MPIASSKGLPHPSPEAIIHSKKLQSLIRENIHQAGGAIPFSHFMGLALYTPRLGYYMSALPKIGHPGDFITAPEISPLFSRCLALAAQEILAILKKGNILEIGAGSGRMAADILIELADRDCLPEQYLILELSADLRQRQQTYLSQRIPHLMPKITWLNRLPDSIQGIIFANEVCDAMPIHCIQIETDCSWERYVGYDQKGEFIWENGPLSDPILDNRINDIRPFLNFEPNAEFSYISEINLMMERWIAELAHCLHQGVVFIIDYGFPQHEYYHWQRSEGTLMCHYQQYAHSDPFFFPGLQDITAHIDFTALAEAGKNSNLSITGYCSQADFLLSCGLDKLIAKESQESMPTMLEISNQVKRLILPSEMGELFKVLALTQGIDQPLLGFKLRDRRTRL
ncbi:class I SAM-dependent methyltransferase [Candidatus Nitrosacidococcus tergens]|uniref:SAM-dependent methyltransferase n=1 Tax=Candidatus Nitrosacidococcus tergens TaxID=553981 RepID=A0A7G1Q755_9GAMM|nr:SAM-dependent methyltransferase [Candidatus Nitrosacidococcus tergens]CAB1274133.1 conserved protein of unknown function [Candidatus Nitrosacidococcus tergens]